MDIDHLIAEGQRLLSQMKFEEAAAAFGEALAQGADTLITVGTLQSNCCRAVSAVAARLGLKAVAVYRDGCKRSQPLSTSKQEAKSVEAAASAEVRPARRKLPDERHSITHKFSIAGHEGYITVGMYEDGKPGEIFLVMAKEGSTISGLMDAFATSISIALQYGVPLEALVEKFSHVRFEPSGFTKNPEIPYAKSITDYIFRWLASKFLSVEHQEAVGVQASEGSLRPHSGPVGGAATQGDHAPPPPAAPGAAAASIVRSGMR